MAKHKFYDYDSTTPWDDGMQIHRYYESPIRLGSRDENRGPIKVAFGLFHLGSNGSSFHSEDENKTIVYLAEMVS